LRWAVLLAGLIAAGRAITGWLSGRPWAAADDRAGQWFIRTLDVQILLGLLLYFVLSPFTTMAFRDFGGAMRDSGLRFWTVEHTFGMLVGIGIAHVGRARIRKSPNDPRRHRVAAIAFTLALIAMIVSIPWPGMPNGRPIFRW
jgi:hypothetical protein